MSQDMPSIASRADIQRIAAAPYGEFMSYRRVLQALEQVAARHPQRTALSAIDVPDLAAEPRRWSYPRLVQDIRRAANLFRTLSGDRPRVALLLPPMAETHIALWGAETAGVACPINYQLNVEHIAELLRACEADILIALGPASDLDIAAKVAPLQAECPKLRHVLHVPAGPEQALPPGLRDFAQELALQDGNRLAFEEPDRGASADLAALFHTGGTTGAPKLARHTHANQLHSAWGAACMFGMRPDDVILNGFPLFHVAGSFVYGLSALLAGAEVVLPTRLGLRNMAFMSRFGEFVERFGVTLIAGVPTVIAGLLALDLSTERLHTVRAMLTGGSPLPDELAAAFEARHRIAVRNILGMTESAGVISIEPLAGPRTPGSCGLPLPYTEVGVQRADGTAAVAGESGILRVRGPNLSPGYTDPQRDAGTFEGGWLVSGDIGHVDDEGRIFVTGRAKDVIIRGAHNIDPGLIEGVLLRHPEVLMAAAVGEPDAYAGELPVAFVSLKAGATVSAEELLRFAAPLIAERPAVPKRIHVVPAIPMTAVGKVYKPALRAQAARIALQALLEQRQLGTQVRVEVDEAPSGMAVRFGAADGAAKQAVYEMMKPFALNFSVVRSDQRLSDRRRSRWRRL
jgi:fatty-acyl-CoA synthase